MHHECCSTSEIRVKLGMLKMFKPPSDLFAGTSFVDPFCYLFSMFIFVMLSCLFLAAL